MNKELPGKVHMFEAATEQAIASTQTTPQSNEAAPTTPVETKIENEFILDNLQKFKFNGKEYTPKQLQDQILMHGDYTKKTQAISEEKKYLQSLRYDVEAVKKNPSLASEFRKIYPKEYHDVLDVLGLSGVSEQPRENSSQGQSNVDPQLQARLDRFETYVQEQEVSKHEAILESTFSKMSQKYPDAIEDVVISRAQALMDSGVRGDEIPWEKLWKHENDRVNQILEDRQSKRLQTQRDANVKAKAPAPGGGLPGQAPVRPKLKDVADFAIKSLTNK